MIWILEMIAVLVAAHYVVRWIDSRWQRRQNSRVGHVITHPINTKKAQKKPTQWWTPDTPAEPLKFDSSSRSSAG